MFILLGFCLARLAFLGFGDPAAESALSASISTSDLASPGLTASSLQTTTTSIGRREDLDPQARKQQYLGLPKTHQSQCFPRLRLHIPRSTCINMHEVSLQRYQNAPGLGRLHYCIVQHGNVHGNGSVWSEGWTPNALSTKLCCRFSLVISRFFLSFDGGCKRGASLGTIYNQGGRSRRRLWLKLSITLLDIGKRVHLDYSLSPSSYLCGVSFDDACGVLHLSPRSDLL